MLHELADAAKRFRDEGVLPPTATKRRTPTWVIEIDDAGHGVPKGPYKRGAHRSLLAPDRQRSGKIGEDNLKPYLLMDDARYALGIAEIGKQDDATLAHQGFVRVLEQAVQQTGDTDLAQVLGFLEKPLSDEITSKVAPRDVITFQVACAAFPVEKEVVQRFWQQYLEEDLRAPFPATCSICGQFGPILQTLPNEIVVMQQKCQTTSFNQSAFRSFGREQTTNSPLCYTCATDAVGALDFLIRDTNHHATLVRDNSKGARNPLRNQLAVFWLKATERHGGADVELNFEDALAALLRNEQPAAGAAGPPPALAQLDALLKVPWTGEKRATHLRANSFYLAVLSANKGRLVIRDWLAVSLDDLIRNLTVFLQALCIVNPMGSATRVFPIPVLLEHVGSGNPSDTRGLLHSAYLGQQPPAGLLQPALRRFQSALLDKKTHKSTRQRGSIPGAQDKPDPLHVLAAVLKLALTFGKEDAQRMERLDEDRDEPAYLCGRVFAVLEEIQRRASRGKLNATIVDRLYGAASTAPGATFGALISRAKMGHLPKIRRENRGYADLEATLGKVLTRLNHAGGFPRALTTFGQAEFALGYYEQRAEFSAKTVAKNDGVRETNQKGGQA